MPDKVKSFREKLSRRSEEAKSRLILALDLSLEMNIDSKRWEEKRRDLVNRTIRLLDATAPELAAVKFNHQLTLPLGIFSDEMAQIMDVVDQSGKLPKIIDCKASDVGHTNRWIANHYFDAGFDALIANPLVGFKGSIEELSQVVKERECGLILLCVMSHPGAAFCFTRNLVFKNRQMPVFEVVARNAAEWGADGLIVGGTYPKLVGRVRSLIPRDLLVISPGLGAQGGSSDGLRKAGVDYFIVGRSIFKAERPAEAARKFRQQSIAS